MSRVMMMLPSGVICGFTLSDRLALRNDIAVAPLDVACWYGSSVPCSMIASWLFAVMTRGLEMILPLPSASSAESSRVSAPVRRLVMSSARGPAAAALPTGAAGRFTLRFCGDLVEVGVPGGGNRFGKSSIDPVWVIAVPLVVVVPIGLGPVLLLVCVRGRATLPIRTPRFF